MNENEKILLEQLQVFIANVSSFIYTEIKARFPGIKMISSSFGIPFGDAEKIFQLPKNQQMEKIKESLGFNIISETALTEDEKTEIYKTVGKQFFRFVVVREELHSRDTNKCDT